MSDPITSDTETSAPAAPGDTAVPAKRNVPREVGGRTDGPDPTRYGDWEKNGRCIDF
jgi:hypothetical protein